MKEIIYNKLVRDRIPEIIESDGKNCRVRILDHPEMVELLKAKLSEEVEEFFQSGELSEIADILEVLEEITRQYGVAWDAVMQIKESKKNSRGGFEKRIFLESVIEDASLE